MNIPTEFKGKIYFYWWAKHEIMCLLKSEISDPEYVLLGESDDLDIDFADPRAAMVESLKAGIEQERAESQRRIQIMQGKIQELLALESK